MTRRLVCCLVLLLFGVASASAPRFLNEPTQQGAPGTYLTLPFRVAGEGAVTFRVTAPDGWLPVSRERTLTLRGETTLPVTLRVPQRGLADERAHVRVDAVRDDRVVTTGHGFAVVEAVGGLRIEAESSLEAGMDAVVLFPVRVENLGNRPDTIRLEARTASWAATVSPSTVTVPPYGTTTVEAALVPAGRFNDGYRYQITVHAQSTVDPDIARSTRVTVVFRDTRVQRRASPDPQLTLRIDTGAIGRMTIAEGATDTNLEYRVRPSLSGDLSDFVSVSILPDAFSGDLDGWTLPSGTSIALQAESWDASLSVAPGRTSMATGFQAGDWRWSVSGTHTRAGDNTGVNFDVTAASRGERLDLQAFGRASLSNTGHAQAFSVLYRVPLDGGVGLEFGAGLVGGERYEVSAYELVPSFSQGLTWVSQRFDLRQSLTAAPTLGRYTVGLAGGMRSMGAFSVRASTRLTLQPDGSRWHTSLDLRAAPAPGFTVGVASALSTADFGARDTWLAVSPSASYAHRFGFGLDSRFTVTYTRRQGLSDDATSSDRVAVGLANRFGSVGLGGRIAYEVREPGGNPYERLELHATTSVRLASRANVSAQYTVVQSLEGARSTDRTIELRWAHVWRSNVTSSLAYDWRVSNTADGDREVAERLAADVRVVDAWASGSRWQFGYSLSATGGLFQPAATYAHDLALAVSFPVNITFDTPAAVTGLFGGRATGHVTGIAFLDRDLDGVFGPGDDPLVGLTVELGGARAVTNEQGQYELRVPEGSHELGFDGLPATLSLLEDASQRVDVNESHVRDLPFAAVTTLTVTLFDDLDRDGVRSEGEPGIAHGGIIVEGPVTRRVRLDGRGQGIVSGLPAGRYTVRVDPDRLPTNYRPTGEAVTVHLEPPQRPPPVSLGAAIPERTVVTTFRPGALSVFAWTRDAARPAGAEMVVEARVQGDPDRVFLELLGHSVPLEESGDTWRVTFRVPSDAPQGLARGVVRAVKGDQGAEAAVQVFVNDQPSYRLAPIVGRAGAVVNVSLRTLFRVERAEVRFASIDPTELSSVDGYTWTGRLGLPPQAGEYDLHLWVDGEWLDGFSVVVTDEAASP